MSYVKGEVSYQVYFNERNNYGVYRVEISETNEMSFDFKKTASITGYFDQLEIGAMYKFDGKMVFNQKYGYTFVVDKYERILPTSKEGVIEYLSGSQFHGIGKKTATVICEHYQDNIIEKIIANKESLLEIPLMNEKKMELIYETLINNKEISDILSSLYSYGLGTKMAMKVYKVYGSHVFDVLKSNPYKLIDDVEGIGFIKADQIALKIGINEKSFNRIEACISYCLLEDAMESGNTFLEKEELINKVKDYLSFNKDDEELIDKSIGSLVYKGRIKEYLNTYADSLVYNSEKYIGLKLELMRDENNVSFFEEEIYRVLEKLELEQDFKYEDEQKEAIYKALVNNVSIITGGPGTGKTTIEKGIIYCYKELISSDSKDIGLCAPTGKAAKRIEESTTYSAKTIHKLLGYDANGNFYYNKFNILPISLLLIDEASMVDVFLFKRLIEAVSNDTKIVIVGDADQLPSIGPGQVLKDLIDSNQFVTTKLKKIHRQKENSKIISLAYDVLDEQINTEIDEKHEELTFIESKMEDLNAILGNVLKHYMGLGYSLHNDIEILIPIYKGIVGIESVNRYIQTHFNSNYNFELATEEHNFFLDDKVIQLVNQYEDGVMNGDMGVITDMLPSKKELVVDFQGINVKYQENSLDNIQLAYSISIHKSQGSEFKVVILPIFPSYKILLNKKLLYTAITRAKEHLVIIGNFRVFSDSVTIASKDRKTRLKTFLDK